jgi:hypothetical protein
VDKSDDDANQTCIGLIQTFGSEQSAFGLAKLMIAVKPTKFEELMLAWDSNFAKIVLWPLSARGR